MKNKLFLLTLVVIFSLFLCISCSTDREYNEEDVLPEMVRRLSDKLTSLTNKNIISSDSRVLFVDDGSRDRTWSLIRQFHKQDARFSGLALTRNNGQQNALIAGLMFAMERCDVAISMDSDLQDDVDAIDEMLERYQEGADIVYGVRSDRSHDSCFQRVTSRMFYRMMNKLGTETIYDHAEYRLMSKRAIEGLSKFEEVNLFLRGVIPMVGYSTAIVTYNRNERFAGESKYCFKKLLALAIEAITSLSVKPLRLISMVGSYIFVMFMASFLWCIAQQECFAGVICSVWCVGGLILVALGILGEYIGKIYLETKGRPRYLVREFLEKSNNTDKNNIQTQSNTK